MTRTYKATGINLKSMPLGEADRLVTVLTPEYGLVRAVAPGARKHNASLSGRSEAFAVNRLLLVRGRSLDKIAQAETMATYPGLSGSLGKLAAGQYLAEIVLQLGLSEQPQSELYELLNEHLRRIERLSMAEAALSTALLPHLVQGTFHLLAAAGVAPQVQACCWRQVPITVDPGDADWQVGFSIDAGGLVCLAADGSGTAAEPQSGVAAPPVPQVDAYLGAEEVARLQRLAGASLTAGDREASWSQLERLLRAYTQTHLGRSIRSATLLEALLAAPAARSPQLQA